MQWCHARVAKPQFSNILPRPAKWSRLAEAHREGSATTCSRATLSDTEAHFATVAFEHDVNAREFASIKSKGDVALFGGNDTRAMKRRPGIPEKKPLADGLSGIAIVAKNLATSMTIYNVGQEDLRGSAAVGKVSTSATTAASVVPRVPWHRARGFAGGGGHQAALAAGQGGRTQAC